MGNLFENLDILIVEDDLVSRLFVENMLNISNLEIRDIKQAGTLEKALTILDENDIDVILLDLNLPDSNGLETLEFVRNKYHQKPIIVITGEEDEKIGLSAISHGAQEYLLKGKFNVDSLAISIRYGIERKESEEKARKNERIFQALISHLPQSVLMKDKNLVFVCCNQKYADKLDTTPEELAGKTDYDIYSKEAAENYRLSDEEVIRTGHSLEDFVRYLDDQGKEKITRLLKTPVKNEKGAVEGVLCVFEDFTERVKAEESIKTANQELEDSNRQLKEMQSQLVQNEKLASIGQLAAGVAHEINNPMGFVTSNFQTLKKYVTALIDFLGLSLECLNDISLDISCVQVQHSKIQKAKEKLNIDFIIEDINELFDDSSEGIDRIIKIVQNLRDFSRVDQAEDFTYYNLNKGIQSTLLVAKNEIKYHADVETDFEEIPDVYCNSGQINQVFLNILVNAAQAIQSQERGEKGHVRIQTRQQENSVEIIIADDGPGIEKENITKIFDPFFTTKPVGKGTGLGLNLSYDIIVNKHHGNLLVESELECGTTFKIELPINHETQNQQSKERNDGKPNSLICG